MHDLQSLLKFSVCSGGTVTEMAYVPLHDVPCFHFHDKVHKHVLTLQEPTPHWGIAKPCHCKWGWRKDEVQGLSVLAGCSITTTARRKLISLLYCQTSYVPLSQIFEKSPLNNQVNPYPTAFPYGNGMVLHFYQQQESSTTKTVHKVINKGLKTYV